MRIRAVVFDLDGVVRHFFPKHVARIETRHGLPAGSIEEFAFSHPLIDDVTTGHTTRAEWIAAIGDHLGSRAAAAEWDAQPVRVDPDVIELAEELKGHGQRVAILTNGTDAVPAEINRLGIGDVFDVVFNSASIGYAKPDIRVFRYVLDTLDLRGPEVFFTDDSPAKLAGGAAAGMITHHFTTAAALRNALRDRDVGVRQ